MNDQLFHGYNCFATAVGQHLINIKKYKAMETVVLRWTFDCNKCWINENVWSVGTCVEAADYLLQYDLEKLEGIKISESKEESFQKSLEIAKNFVNVLDTKEIMLDMLNSGVAKDINVYIGDEKENKQLKDFSIITFKHSVGNKDLGTIGIIGPKRMNYSKVISVMKYLSKKLNEQEGQEDKKRHKKE